jgi:hypothetical protein
MTLFRCLLLGALIVLGGPRVTMAADPIAMVTEIRTGQGEVRVKGAQESDWKPALPLLSLRPDDQVRATNTAVAVLMFTDGQGAVTVTAANSPFLVRSPQAASGSSGKTAELMASVTRVLMGKKKDLSYVPLATRSLRQPSMLLSPRAGKLLDAPTIEWSGSDRVRYTVRVVGPTGVVWEQKDLPRAPLSYPSAAPPLTPSTVYRCELETKDVPVQRGEFVIASAAEAAVARDALAALDPSLLPGFPKSTVVVLRAGYLLENELYAPARQELLAALAADPDEPTLHLLLGYVYDRTGLTRLAAEEFDEAQFLSTRTP